MERQGNKTQEAPLSALHPFTSLILSVVFSSFCLLSHHPPSLVSDPPRRIAAVKLFDVFISPGHDPAVRAELGLTCARLCQSEFLTSSSDPVVTSVLTAPLEKRGSPHSVVHL